ncbi:WecB/TagA/CpsF family glycosyltransferase [Gelidibacter japonicus]|jgi:N-acetylglucosaminyldiphosphoundecaprenol N-acetyl-beta-D-mannosaminyltransferase|uniref:WecB/TagA/CpsF family glycosyltransferase n=1 Tax=Gelidibacter japonicus TaxID=1962232 RepID=UPI003A9161C3
MIKSLLPKITSQLDYFQPNTITAYVNLYNYLIFRQNPEIIKDIDRFTLDGILMVRILNLIGGSAKRASPDFSSYFSEMFLFCEKFQKKLVFVGGSNSELVNFISQIEKSFPTLKIQGALDGYFSDEESNIIAKDILDMRPDIVILGLGTPKQEIFAILLKSMGFNGNIYTCGAFISQTALKGVNYYPEIINTLHLRWLYRIFKEKKLLKRYFLLYPLSIWYLLIDYLRT